MAFFCLLTFSKDRGGEWFFQKYESRKLFVKFLRSRSLDFCADCQRRSRSLKFLQGS